MPTQVRVLLPALKIKMAKKEMKKEVRKVRVIDASDLLLGRLASQVAKMALLGERVVVINSEKVRVSGTKKTLLEEFKPKGGIGRPFHGPFANKMPDRLVRRVIRGMLPFHKDRGREAYRRIRCYIGLPDEFKDVEAETLESALTEGRVKGNTMTVGKIASLIGKYRGKE